MSDLVPAGAWRVVLVDDHALVRTGIGTILSAFGDLEVVGEAASGEEALTVVRATDPDVVCMDVEMPGMGGLAAARALVGDPDVRARVLMLTTFEREDYLLAALEAGASGFALKNSRADQLADAIRVVAAGDALIAPELTRAVIQRAMASPAEEAAAPMASDAVVDLTERELEVLRLLATGMSNEEIAAHLWLGRATIKTHVSNVLAKLGLRDRVQAVAFAYRNGVVR